MTRARKKNNASANLGFETKLRQAADALRTNMDAAEYKPVVLGLIFLKYVSDAFEEKHARLGRPQAWGQLGRPGRVPHATFLLGTVRGALVATQGPGQAAINICGQVSHDTTWRLARVNLATRDIDGQIAHGDSFHNDRFPDLKADNILADPPFNVSDWRGELLRDYPQTGRAGYQTRHLNAGTAWWPACLPSA